MCALSSFCDWSIHTNMPCFFFLQCCLPVLQSYNLSGARLLAAPSLFFQNLFSHINACDCIALNSCKLSPSTGHVLSADRAFLLQFELGSMCIHIWVCMSMKKCCEQDNLNIGQRFINTGLSPLDQSNTVL